VNAVIPLDLNDIDFKAMAQHQMTDRELLEFIDHSDLKSIFGVSTKFAHLRHIYWQSQAFCSSLHVPLSV